MRVVRRFDPLGVREINPAEVQGGVGRQSWKTGGGDTAAQVTLKFWKVRSCADQGGLGREASPGWCLWKSRAWGILSRESPLGVADEVEAGRVMRWGRREDRSIVTSG